MLRGLFSSLLCDKMGENFDFIYDWTTQSDLRKRKTESNNNIDGLSTSVYQISEKKSIQKKESESILSVKRKNETTNGNNYVLFKSNNNSNHFMSNNNIDVDIGDKNGNNVFIYKIKENDNKVESKCCLM